MKILICDDDKLSMANVQIHVAEYMKEHFIKAEFFTSTNSKECVDSDTIFDLAFLDIQMPEIDGISLAKELKKRNSRIILFFVTAFEEYQDEAMDLHIFRFFDKPLDVTRLYSSLDKAMEYLNEAYVDIIVQNENKYKKLLIDNIKFVKRENRKTIIYTTEGIFVVKNSFDELINSLPNTFFYLVHKSFYVNLHYITEYGYREIFIDNERISVAPRKQSGFHKYWFNYVKRR